MFGGLSRKIDAVFPADGRVRAVSQVHYGGGLLVSEKDNYSLKLGYGGA